MSGLCGVAYVAEVPGMRRRCRGREAERPGPLMEAPGGGPGRDMSPEVPAGRERIPGNGLHPPLRAVGSVPDRVEGASRRRRENKKRFS